MSIRTVRVVPTVTVGAYSAGDAVGQRMGISLPFGSVGGQGKLVSLSVLDKANQKALLNILLMRESFTAVADNVAMAVSDADLTTKLAGLIQVAAAEYFSIGTAQAIATKLNINLPITFPRNKGSLYFQAWTTGTPTYAAVDDLEFLFSFETQ